VGSLRAISAFAQGPLELHASVISARAGTRGSARLCMRGGGGRGKGACWRGDGGCGWFVAPRARLAFAAGSVAVCFTHAAQYFARVSAARSHSAPPVWVIAECVASPPSQVGVRACGATRSDGGGEGDCRRGGALSSRFSRDTRVVCCRVDSGGGGEARSG